MLLVPIVVGIICAVHQMVTRHVLIRHRERSISMGSAATSAPSVSERLRFLSFLLFSPIPAICIAMYLLLASRSAATNNRSYC